MERKKTLTMNWDALGDYDDDDDDDRFFETKDRLSSAVAFESLDSSGSDDDDEDEFEDPRTSFASSISPLSTTTGTAASPEYDVWMAAPGSISERRKRLLQGMGLASKKELLKMASNNNNLSRAISNKALKGKEDDAVTTTTENNNNNNNNSGEESLVIHPSHSPLQLVLVRSRSESDIESFSIDKKRKEKILGHVSKQRLTRTSSMIIVSHARAIYPYQESVRIVSPSNSKERHKRTPSGGRRGEGGGGGGALRSMTSSNQFGAFFLIKNLDTGKEFIVNEYDQDGMWNRVSDLQTGKKLTLEEFERCVGHSPVVKELMRRQNVNGGMGYVEDQEEGQDRKINTNSYFSKSLRMSKRTGAALLKNIKGVAHSMSSKGGVENSNCVSDNYNDYSKVVGPTGEVKQGWVKVRQTGKSYKELSALHLCQEIQAHEGSVWTIRFSSDGRFLASGGEDKVIHVWEVQECEIMSLGETGGLLAPSLSSSPSGVIPGIGEVNPLPSERKKKKNKKKGSCSKKVNSIPEYVHVPETVFSLSEKPVCSFVGHLDDVLDLSWSRSHLLLSSSMDKTVRLWDLETKSCLKLFAHNDYVTCIQFNPMDDNYFISGSLDAKVRIWSIPDRQLVDWADLHEMVTAVCFTPDGQGALIGSHKGSCRMYKVEDCKLNLMERIDLWHKKKSHAKKITGFQFSPGNPSEVLVTAADSRIRILDGSDIVHKFKGFKNINSQISASFSLDGKYVICASEDSYVYVWKRDEARVGTGKGKTVIHTRSHESFQCKDVSVAVSWPGTVKGEPPSIQMHSKRHSKRSSTLQTPSATPSAMPTGSNSPTKDDVVVQSKRNSQQSPGGSPTREDKLNEDTEVHSQRHSQQSPSGSPTREENHPAASSKRQLPPLPKKNNLDRVPTPPEEDLSQISSSESGIKESFASNSSSIRYGDSPSISAAATPSWSSSWSWFDSGHGNNAIQATAWGLVIVTATLGGEIRAYQNFGLPRRIGRQTNLF